MSKIAEYAGSGISCLMLVDAEGNVVSHSYEGKTFLGPTKVMNEIKDKTAQWPGASIQGHYAGGDPVNGPIFPVANAGQPWFLLPWLNHL